MKNHIAVCFILFLVLFFTSSCKDEQVVKFADHINDLLQLILPYKQPLVEYNAYLDTATESAIEGNTDYLNIPVLTSINQIFTHNKDSFNACASNFVLGIVCHHNEKQDSAIMYLLTAESFSNGRPELKPHIYYYLASASIVYDPILAHDIIYSHQDCCIDRYDYSRFLNIKVNSLEQNIHNFNSVYYSRLLQSNLNTQAEQHQKEIRLYHTTVVAIVVFSIIIIITLVLVILFRRKTVVLKHTIANQQADFDTLQNSNKAKFNSLLKQYMELYRDKCDKKSVYEDANKILSALRDNYPTLTKSDIAIIWLTLLAFSAEDICSTLNFTMDYYRQRRSKISKALQLGKTKNLNNDLMAFIPEFLFGSMENG